MIESGGFLRRLLGPLLKTGLPLLGSGTTTLIIPNDQLQNIKIVISLEHSGLLLNLVTEKVQNEVKEEKGRSLSMLLGTLGPSLLGNLLTGKGATATSKGRGIYRAGKCKGINRAGEGL